MPAYPSATVFPMQQSVAPMNFPSARPTTATPHIERHVMRLAGPIGPGTRVLDIGCGNGYWAGRFAKEGAVAVGIDPSPSGIDIARRTYPAARFEQLAAGRDPLADLGELPFDIVVSTEVVEHLYDPPGWATGCFAALRPGGRLVLSTPYHGRLKNVAVALAGKSDDHYDSLRVGGHIKFFSRSTIERLLNDAGFVGYTFAGAGRVPLLWRSMVLAAHRPDGH
jgi:SAM-dependent methyltransferase